MHPPAAPVAEALGGVSGLGDRPGRPAVRQGDERGLLGGDIAVGHLQDREAFPGQDPGGDRVAVRREQGRRRAGGTQQLGALDQFRQPGGDHPGVLGGADLPVAGVHDELGAVEAGGAQLRRGGEGRPAPTGETGGLDEVDDVGHDHSWLAMSTRRDRSACEVTRRQTTNAATTREDAMLRARSRGWFEVPRAMPCTTAKAHSA